MQFCNVYETFNGSHDNIGKPKCFPNGMEYNEGVFWGRSFLSWKKKQDVLIRIPGKRFLYHFERNVISCVEEILTEPISHGRTHT